jgi:hypothetical protein
MQGQTIFISNPGGQIRSSRPSSDDNSGTPIRGQIRQNNFIRIDKSQLGAGNQVKLVRNQNGQLQTTTGSPVNHTVHHVQGGIQTRRILPTQQSQNNPAQRTPIRTGTPQRVTMTPTQTGNQRVQNTPGTPVNTVKGNQLRLITVDRNRKPISGVQVAKIKLPSHGAAPAGSPQTPIQQTTTRFCPSPSTGTPRPVHQRIIQNTPPPRPAAPTPVKYPRVSGMS